MYKRQVLFRWALGRDWRAGAILAGYAGGYLPWFLVGDRTIYQFYACLLYTSRCV